MMEFVIIPLTDSPEDWNITKLFELYSYSKIHFKDIVRISGYSFSTVIHLFANSDFRPPYSDLAEKKAEEISVSLSKDKIYKNPGEK